MPREACTSDKIAAPVGPYSPGVRAGKFLFISGQVALDPATGGLVGGDAAVQTEQIFRNLEPLLRSTGKTFSDVIKAVVFLTNMRDFPAMNTVYGRRFDAPYPARTTVGVAALPLGAAVEIDFIVR